MATKQPEQALSPHQKRRSIAPYLFILLLFVTYAGFMLAAADNSEDLALARSVLVGGIATWVAVMWFRAMLLKGRWSLRDIFWLVTILAIALALLRLVRTLSESRRQRVTVGVAICEPQSPLAFQLDFRHYKQLPSLQLQPVAAAEVVVG